MPAFWPDGRISTSLYDTENHAGVMAVQIWLVSVSLQPHSGVLKNLPQKFEHGKFRPHKSIIGGLMGEQQRIVFIDGKFVPETGGSRLIFDRGLLFADAVYEG